MTAEKILGGFAALPIDISDSQKGRSTRHINVDLLHASEQHEQGKLPPIGEVCLLVRCKVFRLTKLQYAERSSINPATVRQMEWGNADEKSYALNANFWQQAPETQQDNSLKLVVSVAREFVLDILVDKEDVRTFAFLKRLMLKHGANTLEEKTGLKRATLNRRRTEKAICQPGELIESAQALGEIDADLPVEQHTSHPLVVSARESWEQDAVSILGWKKPLARLFSWIATSKIPTDDHSLAKNFNLTSKEARRLSTGLPPSNETVQSVVHTLQKANILTTEIGEDILQEWVSREKEVSFRDKIQQRFDEMGLNNRLLSDILSMKETTAETDPTTMVREAINQGAHLMSVSTASLCALAAQSPQELEELLSSARKEIEERSHQKGSKQHPVYFDRILHAIKCEALEPAFATEEVQKLERHRPTKITSPDDLAFAIRVVGESKMRKSLQRWQWMNSIDSVHDIFQKLPIKKGGHVPLAESAGMGPNTFLAHQKDIEGLRTPAFPVITNLLDVTNTQASDALQVDWRLRRANRSKNENMSDLARAFDVCITEHAMTPSTLFEKHNLHQDTYLQEWKNVREQGDLKGGYWKKFLSIIKVSESPHLESYFHLLRRTKNIPAALEQWVTILFMENREDLVGKFINAQQYIQGLSTHGETDLQLTTLRELMIQKMNKRDRDGKQRIDPAQNALEILRFLPGVTIDELSSWQPTGELTPLVDELRKGKRNRVPSNNKLETLTNELLQLAHEKAAPHFKPNWNQWCEASFRRIAKNALLEERGNMPRALKIVLENIARINKGREGLLDFISNRNGTVASSAQE